MALENPALLALVRAVCDGARVDWDSVGAKASDSFKSTLDELRAVADIANLNRSLSGETGRAEAVPVRTVGHPVGPFLARWGHLHLLEHVASGSFGDVYRAWDPAIDREVALKLLRPHARDQADPDETIEEGRLLARVRHPSVVTVYGAARIDGRVGIWMEFVHGRTLAGAVQQDGALSPDDVIARGVTLCDAVAAVHDAGLLHRDIKAQNVMLASDGRLVLMDFGAGRPVDERSRDVAGTPLYLAPEVVKGREATIRSDVYSLGVLLHFLATATFPRLSPGPLRELQRQGVAIDRPSAPSLTSLSPGLDRIIARAIAWDPDARFESARGLGEALRALSEPIPRDRQPVAFMVAAAALLFVVSAAAIPLVRARLGGAPASAPATSAGPIPGEEGTRKLPWQVVPTGPPSRTGRFMGAVDWDHRSGDGVPVVIDLSTNTVRKLLQPPENDANAGSYSASSSIAPDATHIAFSWSIPPPKPVNELRVSGLDGSSMRTVYRDPESEFAVVGWSAKSDEVLLLRHRPAGRSELVWVDVRDGALRLVTRLPFVPFTSLHPNGRDLLIDAPQADAPDKRDLMIADMLTGEIRPLLTAPASDTMPVWLPDGHHVLFGSDRGGTFGAWLTDAAGAEPQQVRGSMGSWQPVGFGAHDELYYLAQTGTVDVYTAPIDLVSRTVGRRRRVPIAFEGRNLFSDWAPDGHHLAFTSRRGLLNIGANYTSIVVRDVLSNDERVLATFSDAGPPRWSPDGRRLATLMAGPTAGIRVIDTRSGRVEVGCPVGNVWNVEWASDDRVWLIANERRSNSLRELTLPSCAIRELAPDVLFFSMSRAHDQVAIASQTRDGITVTVARLDALDDGHEIFRSPAPGQLQFAGWTADDEFILAVGSVGIAGQPPPAGRELLAIPSQGGAPISMSLAVLGDPPQHARLSPDGSQISYEAGAPEVTSWVLEHPLFTRH